MFTNLVDFDSKYGHRNDPRGYAAAIEAFDARLPELVGALGGGCCSSPVITGATPPRRRPTTRASARRCSPPALTGGPFDIGTRASFGDLGATVADLLGVRMPGGIGESFADRIGPRGLGRAVRGRRAMTRWTPAP